MKYATALLSAIVLTLSAGFALAAEDTGKVKAVDPPSRTLTLDNGTQFRVTENVMIELLKPGQEVTVSYEEQDGQRIANDVMIEK
jgi:Cu/Ag efflux protein CusF